MRSGICSAPHGLRPIAQQFNGLGQAGEAVDAPRLRIKVDELRRGVYVFRDGLKFPVLDDVGDEALSLLDLHGVEHGPIRIDPHEKRVPGPEGVKFFIGR